jgi:hypothetical protein
MGRASSDDAGKDERFSRDHTCQSQLFGPIDTQLKLSFDRGFEHH